MRVALLGPWPPPWGGVQTNVVDIREYVREQGHTCAVIGITRHRQPERDDLFFPQAAPGLISRLFRGRYDIIHLHVGGAIPLRVIALALTATLAPRARSVLTLHSGGYPSSADAGRLTRRSLLAVVLRRFDALIGVNREMIDMFVRLGVAPERAHLIPPHAVARAKIASRLTDPLASFFARHNDVLIAVSGLEPEYDLPRQVEALGEVLKSHPRTGLAILG